MFIVKKGVVVMKIKFNHVRAITFEDLSRGQLFRRVDDLETVYLKTEEVDIVSVNDDAVNAVDMATGYLNYFDGETEVFPFEATLVEQFRER